MYNVFYTYFSLNLKSDVYVDDWWIEPNDFISYEHTVYRNSIKKAV